MDEEDSVTNTRIYLQKSLDSALKTPPHQHPERKGKLTKKMWPILFEPFENELFSSWFTRISLANLSNPSQRVQQFNIKTNRHDYDMEINDSLFVNISDKTGIEMESLMNHTFYYENQNYNSILTEQINTVKIFNAICFTSWNERGKNTFRFCPECLKADPIPYFRKSWRYTFFTFCPIHNCYLENQCPNCHSPVLFYKLDWNSKIYYCYNCHFNLADTKSKKIPRLEASYSRYQEFLNSQTYSSRQVFLLITLAWFIANFCDITDPIYHRSSSVPLQRKY